MILASSVVVQSRNDSVDPAASASSQEITERKKCQSSWTTPLLCLVYFKRVWLQVIVKLSELRFVLPLGMMGSRRKTQPGQPSLPSWKQTNGRRHKAYNVFVCKSHCINWLLLQFSDLLTFLYLTCRCLKWLLSNIHFFFFFWTRRVLAGTAILSLELKPCTCNISQQKITKSSKGISQKTYSTNCRNQRLCSVN